MKVPEIGPDVSIIKEIDHPSILADIVFGKETIDKFVHL